MFLPILVFSSSLSFLSSVLCKPDNVYAIYNEFFNEVINFNEIRFKIQESFFDTEEGTLAGLKMFDASSKFPNGLIAGAFFDLGHFDECYNIEYQNIYGKYCLGTLPITAQTQKYFEAFGLSNNTSTQRQTTLGIHPKPRLLELGPPYEGLHLATCVPSSWSALDIPGLLEYTEEFCYSRAKEPHLSSGVIATIVVLSIFTVIIAASTVFDIYLHFSKKEPPHELLIAFSFLSNGRKLFQITTDSDQLLCLNGIKAISMMWVILGHEYAEIMNAPLSNYLDTATWQQNFGSMIIIGASVSVDTFFVVGGLVTVYVFLKSVDKGVKFNILLYYIHRYLRLTPALAIMVLIHIYLFNYIAKGPLWYIADLAFVKVCEQSWWSTLLYITNYVQRGVCLPQAWYLSVDMQLFVLTPLLLIPLKKWTKLTLQILGALTVAGCIVPFTVSYVEEIGLHSMSFNNDHYTQAYTRFGPYVMGMILGYYLYRIKKCGFKTRLSPLTVIVLWIICLTLLVVCVYAGHSLYLVTTDDRLSNALYLGFNRPAWALALCGIIFLCVSGYGTPIDKFLSSSIFQFLTKLSYSMYLVHASVITIRYTAMKNIMKFSDIGQMHIFWGDFMFTLFFSVILTLSFEYPVVIVEKYLFGRWAFKATHLKRKAQM